MTALKEHWPEMIVVAVIGAFIGGCIGAKVNPHWEKLNFHSVYIKGHHFFCADADPNEL